MQLKDGRKSESEVSAAELAADALAVFDPGTYQKGVPFEALTRLREEKGVVWVDEPGLHGWPEGPGYWLVLRYDDVDSVVTQPRLFSSHIGGTQIRDPATPQDLRFVQRMMLNMDPPEHTRLRRLLVKSFTSNALADLDNRIRVHAEAIVDRVVGNRPSGCCDFAKEVAADLPLLALAEILGVPAEDRMLMFDWSNRVIGYQDPDYATSSAFDLDTGSALAKEALSLRPKPDASGRMPDPRSRDGMPDLYAYAHLLAREKRRNPGNDVMSVLLALYDEDGRLSVEEFENMFWLFAVAGNETLRNGIPGACIALIENPAAQDELLSCPALLQAAISEALRWWSPVMNFRRTASLGSEIGGCAIEAGDKVVVSFISANRDPRKFECPDAFDLHRPNTSSMAFGQGPHFCLGAQLARMQMRRLFAEVLHRMGRLEYDGEPTFLRSNFQRGVKCLPIRRSRR